jgi:outer membrane protein assembly factor BamB
MATGPSSGSARSRRRSGAPPVVADVDADDAREVVVGTDERTVAFSPDGTIDWQVETPGVDVQLGPAAVGSGRMLYTAADEGITALDGRDGSTVWHRSSRGGASLSHAAVRDGDGDGTPEVYYSEPGTVVGALEATTGDQVWSTRLGTDEYTMTPAPVVGDLTGDGTEEVVAVTNSGTVTVLAPSSGDQLAVYEREVPVWTFPTVGDVTDSSGSEILIRYGDGRVVALEYTESD